MKELTREEYILYRLEKSEESLAAAELLIKNNMWNAAVNRIYYSCFYSVSALLFKCRIQAKSHAGIRTKFFQEFIKTGKLNIEYGRLYSDLFDWRQTGDYSDMIDFTKDEIEPILPAVRQFLELLKGEIHK